jgi:hypothetical protein
MKLNGRIYFFASFPPPYFEADSFIDDFYASLLLIYLLSAPLVWSDFEEWAVQMLEA